MAGAKDYGAFKACHWSRRYLGAFIAVVLTLALFPVFGNAAPPEGTVPRADEPAEQAQYAPTANAKPYAIKEKELVFLLHGIGKGAYDMAALAKRINNAGYAVLNWEYPSTDHALAELADKLAVQVARFPEYKIHFVTHSMGGIVVRTYLSKYGVENVGRLVMIAPPSQGAELAEFFCEWPIYKYMLGPAGQELKPGELGKCVAAGIPDCEFGIIAGGIGRSLGINPLLPGDNDGTVTVESTKLEGAQDFALVPYPHPVIQMMPRTAELTLHFLETGQFKPEDKK